MAQQSDPMHGLRQVTLFAGLPEEALAKIGQVSQPRRYRKGQVFCLEGEPGNALYILEEGLIRVTHTLASGEEALLAVVEAPAALGELALLDGAHRSGTLTAGSAVVVRTVPRHDFVAILREQPAVVLALLKNLAGIIRRGNERQIDLLTLDVPGRLAKWLLERAATHGNAYALGRNQSDLAAELGTTRSTLNRALNGFAEMGLIETEGDKVTIVSPERLRDFTG